MEPLSCNAPYRPPNDMPSEFAEPSSRAEPPRDEIDARISAVLSVAADHRSGIPLTELAELLPEDGGMPAESLERWLRARPHLASVEDGWVAAPGIDPRRPSEVEARSERYASVARELTRGPLADLLAEIDFLGVSGSVAYGGPGPDDDLDLVLFTPEDRLWWVFVRTHWRLRAWRRRQTGRVPAVCLNYGRAMPTAEAEFVAPQDFLFAREALAVRPLHGEEAYTALLRRSAWMREVMPGLYDRRLREVPGAGRPASRRRSGAALRITNAASFVVAAIYLQSVGLVRNRRLRRAGRTEALFRTETRWDRFSVSSIKFERIRARYPPVSAAEERSVATARGPAVAPSDPSSP